MAIVSSCGTLVYKLYIKKAKECIVGVDRCIMNLMCKGERITIYIYIYI